MAVPKFPPPNQGDPVCGTCKFYNAMASGKGFCNRYPPTPYLPYPRSNFPIVLDEWNCGEWRNKVLV